MIKKITLVFAVIPMTLFAMAHQDVATIVCKQHLEKLNNLDEQNPPTFVLFSGPQGSGKSTVSQALEQSELHAVHISFDATHKLIHDNINSKTFEQKALIEAFGGKKINDTLLEHVDRLIGEIRTQSMNQLIILDGTFNEALYEKMKRTFDRYDIPYFWVHMNIRKETAIERLKQRETDPSKHLDALKTSYPEYQEFTDKHKMIFNYVFDNDGNTKSPNIAPLVITLKNFLKQRENVLRIEAIQEHCNELKNRNIQHPSRLFSFSGLWGSGKTTIAKKLEDRGFVCISLDTIRTKLKSRYVHPPKKASDEEKIASVMQHLDALLYAIRGDKNKLIVIDDDLYDEKHEQAMQVINNHQLPLSLIQIDIDKNTARDRLVAREDALNRPEVKQWFLDNWDKACKKYQASEAHRFDFVIDNNTDSPEGPDITQLIESIKTKHNICI